MPQIRGDGGHAGDGGLGVGVCGVGCGVWGASRGSEAVPGRASPPVRGMACWTVGGGGGWGSPGQRRRPRQCGDADMRAACRSSLSRPRRVGSALGKESCRAMWGGKESNSFLGCEYMREIASSVERWGKRRRERRKSRWEGGEGSEHLLLAIIESNRKVKLERGKSAHGYGISITVSLNSVLVVMSIT